MHADANILILIIYVCWCFSLFLLSGVPTIVQLDSASVHFFPGATEEPRRGAAAVARRASTLPLGCDSWVGRKVKGHERVHGVMRVVIGSWKSSVRAASILPEGCKVMSSHVSVHTCIYIYACTLVVSLFMHVCLSVCMCVCIYVCNYVCMHVCTYVGGGVSLDCLVVLLGLLYICQPL